MLVGKTYSLLLDSRRKKEEEAGKDGRIYVILSKSHSVLAFSFFCPWLHSKPFIIMLEKSVVLHLYGKLLRTYICKIE